MPWLTILMMVISYFLQNRSTPEARRKAALGAVLAGGATYAVTHGTDWGRENLGAYDGVVSSSASGLAAVTAANGAAAANGTTTSATTPPAGANGWDVLKGWGPTGTALVAGTVGAAANPKSLLPLLLLGGAALLLLR